MLKWLLVTALLVVPSSALAGRLYVIDTGVNIVGVDDVDFIGGNARDCHGHGTAMATLTNVPATSITNVRALDCNGWSVGSSIENAMAWVASVAVQGDTVLMAIGSAVWNNPDYTRDAIINTSIDSGVTWVVPAGNSNDWAFYWVPGRIEKALVVGAADGLYRATFSNYGPTVDVFADACAIGWCGSSVSAAIVAGLAWSILDAAWYWPPAHVRNLIAEVYAQAVMVDPGPGTTFRRLQ